MLSIVTITYKDAAGLRSTIASLRVLAGRTDFEHVVVDGSPELNREVLESLPTAWPLRHVTLPPRGIYPALNDGWRAARGEFVWFLNGGDVLADLRSLDAMLSELRGDSSIDALCGGVWPARDGVRLAFGRRPEQSFRESIVGFNQVPHQGVFYRRRVFEQVGPLPEEFRILGDYLHFWMLSLAGRDLRLSAEFPAEVDLGGISSNANVLWLREMWRIQRWLRTRIDARTYARHLSRFVRFSAQMAAVNAGEKLPRLKRFVGPIYKRVFPDPWSRAGTPPVDTKPGE